MKRIAFCFGTIALAVGTMAIAGCHAGGPDLAAMGKVMAEAKSYRMTTVASGSEVTVEIECPDKMRTLTKAAGNTSEMVRVGSDTYLKMGDKWMKTPAGGASTPVCAAAGTTTASTTNTASPNVTKGESTTVNGTACQEWTIGAAGASTTYCIAADNYPVQVKTAAATITYSDWNKVKVTPPAI